MAKFVLALLVAYAGWRLWKDAFGYEPKQKPVRREGNGDTGRQAARAMLGVGPAANDAEIRAAHRRLMGEAHPDHGGSEARARELNAARDLLIGRG